MTKHKKHICIILALLALLIYTGEAQAETLLKADKRIKTFVYNQNEVYTIVARNGFQTALEFAEDEKIDTISLGDPVGWRITNSGRRVFVKPIHTKGVTNLSVFTNRRAYQFELVATSSKDNRSNHSYIVRFYYPNSAGVYSGNTDRTRNSLRPVSATAIPNIPVLAPRPALPPAVAQPTPRPALPPVTAIQPAPRPILPPAPPAPAPAAQDLNTFNFNYTLSGPETIAPKKIFDDGKSTYFEFTQPTSNLNFAIMDAAGNETPIPASQKSTQSGSIFIVNNVASKFSVRDGSDIVCVYNEQIRSLPPTNLVTSRSGSRY